MVDTVVRQRVLIGDLLDHIAIAKELFETQPKDNQFSILAAEALILRMGEMVKRLSKLEAEKYSKEPWTNVARMRDFIAHHYDRVVQAIIWNAFGSPMLELEAECSKELAALTALKIPEKQ